MSENKYDILSDIEHTLQRPDTYIGNINNTNKECFTANNTEKRIIKKIINYNAGFFKIISEILSNAIDNFIRSINTKTKCDVIKIDISHDEISVYNNGMVIPLDKMTVENKDYYLPNIIFGMFKSGSNFNDNEYRYGTGRNGLGAKLTNIYSKMFTIEILNNKKLYKQTWRNNMKICEEPSITKYDKNDCNYVKITWKPDFIKFNLDEYFVDDQIDHLRKLCYDMAGLLVNGVNVYFNNDLLTFKNFKTYCDIYDDFNNENKNNYILLENNYIKNIKNYESVVYITPKLNTNSTLSFVNSLYTEKGGIHQDVWCEKIFKELITKICKKNTKIDYKQIKQFFNIAISCRLPNPSFDTQSKVKLTGFTADNNDKKKNKIASIVNVDISKIINDMLKWDIIIDIKKYIERKNDDKFDADIKKQYKNANIKEYDCANRSGSNKYSKYCSLFLCEGLSAKTYVIEGLNKICAKKYMENSFTKNDELNNILNDKNFNGRDYIGIYPLTGVLMNTRNNKDNKLSKNKVISEISSILNLSTTIDYDNVNHFNKLPYGKVVILTDADEDGKHIKGLILNLFHDKYKSLLDKDYVITMNTPILKINIKRYNKIILFYNEYLGKKYIENNKEILSSIKYYKGLGTSSNDDIHSSFGVNMQIFKYDKNTNNSIITMFDCGKADERKILINDFVKEINKCDDDLVTVEKYINSVNASKTNPNIHIVEDNIKKISDFMRKDMVEFSYENCKRTIPNIMDGLKQSQRKILYGLFTKNLNFDKQVIKVAQLSGYVAQVSNYHHGEQNLNDTIINMAKDCIGSNNIPLLYPSGQFGTRGENNAAAARYIFTKLNKLTKFIYKTIDNVLLDYITDDGVLVEPTFYLPVIPMVLVNKIKGIGSGYSTDIQCYNIEKIIEYIKNWLINGTYLDIIIEPWYRNFKGNIKHLDNDKWEMTGTYTQDKNIITITEIPVTVSINDIKIRLEELEKDNKIVKYKNRSTATDPIFDIQLNNAEFSIYELVPKMKTTISSTNMQMFDRYNNLTKFDNIYDIMKYFIKERIIFYEKRRLYIIDDIKEELKKISNKYRFITTIISDSDPLFKNTYEKLLSYLKDNKYDLDVEGTYKYLTDLPTRNYTKDQLEKLKNELENKKKDLTLIQSKTDKDLWLEDIEDLENEYKKNN
tara:strand:+ start:8137 stop:11625 length:3489 start_codon:yes stop_codon:yes gene_type:complete